MKGDDDLKKKRNQKRGNQVPIQELGFKSKIYYGIQTEYNRRRRRYKAAKYGAQNSKDCFMGRLRFMLDVTSLSPQQLQNLGNFKGIRKQQWSKVKHIVYNSKDQLICSICLQQTFNCPQMTSCGHVFCWHCIVMHYYKSLKANNCPVCNQIFELQNIVSCQPIYTKNFTELKDNHINLALKARREGDSRVYDPETLFEDLSFGRIVKAMPSKILKIYKQELREIEQYAKNCQDDEIKKWMQKVHSLCWQKIDKIQVNLQKKEYKLHRKQKMEDSNIFTALDEKQKNNLITFYQEKSGRLIFLHPICQKYLRKSGNSLPMYINQEIIYWQEAEYNIDLIKKYKNIAHITVNQEIDLIIINIKSLVQPQLYAEFEISMKQFRQRKREQLQRQQKEAEKLSAKYQSEKQYLSTLKRLEEAQFFDIKVPVTIDPNQIGDTIYFPSLIQTHSTPLPEREPHVIAQTQAIRQKVLKNAKPIMSEGDFPVLFQQKIPVLESSLDPKLPQKLIYAKSQQVTSTPISIEADFPVIEQQKKQGNGMPNKKKKKKEKFVNVTDLFFKDKEEDYFP